jgi:hypothetical protein
LKFKIYIFLFQLFLFFLSNTGNLWSHLNAESFHLMLIFQSELSFAVSDKKPFNFINRINPTAECQPTAPIATRKINLYFCRFDYFEYIFICTYIWAIPSQFNEWTTISKLYASKWNQIEYSKYWFFCVNSNVKLTLRQEEQRICKIVKICHNLHLLPFNMTPKPWLYDGYF